jgi:hypothetical protein
VVVFLYCFKNVLNKYLRFIESLKILKNILKGKKYYYNKTHGSTVFWIFLVVNSNPSLNKIKIKIKIKIKYRFPLLAMLGLPPSV